MKNILLAITLMLTACTKQTPTAPVQVQKPVLIKVEAEHINGEVVNSPIILVR